MSLPWDESTRPAGPAPDPGRELTAEEMATGQHLVDVHDGLRAELERLRGVVDEVGAGEIDPAALRSFFNRADRRLGAVLERLGDEHEAIAELLERIDAALVALVASEPGAMDRVREAVDLVGAAMASHFSYEERELVEPLARLGVL